MNREPWRAMSQKTRRVVKGGTYKIGRCCLMDKEEEDIEVVTGFGD